MRPRHDPRQKIEDSLLVDERKGNVGTQVNTSWCASIILQDFPPPILQGAKNLQNAEAIPSNVAPIKLIRGICQSSST